VGPLLDVRVFTNRTFSASAGAIAINYFALFGFIFLITQYFQLIRGYSALSAGIHTLPFAAVVMVATPLGAVASLRVGARYVVATGLLIVGAALAWGGTIAAHAAYVGPVVAVMVLLALGFSLVNAPSTASLMSTLRPDQVGAGSAVNETTRELAGSMGVAVVGSVFSSLFAPGIRAALARFVGHGLTSAQLQVASSSTRAAQVTVSHFPLALRPGLDASVTNAFMQGFTVGVSSPGRRGDCGGSRPFLSPLARREGQRSTYRRVAGPLEGRAVKTVH
jgi:DHA2 family multidrug resistance protein-like MFS transporter